MDGGRPEARQTRVLPVAIAALGVTQISGWGTTFYVPAVLGNDMAAGIGLPLAVVFGGVSVMLLGSAALAPPVGRLLDRYGARPIMTAGSLLLALGLVIVSASSGAVSYLLGWSILGIAAPFAMGQAASTAMVQIAPERARVNITVLLLISGLSSTASWPVLIWLQGKIGWRESLMAYAALHACLCAPLHYLGLPPRRPETGDRRRAATSRPDQVSRRSGGPASTAAGVFPLCAATLSLAGFVTWGIPLHILPILADFGHSPGSAVAIGVLLGPGQVLARLFDLVGGRRLDILVVGIGAAALMPVALLTLYFAGASSIAAIAFTLGYAISAGLSTIVRAVAPLRLYGEKAYARTLGTLSAYQNVAFASAPIVFAAVRDTFGVRAVILMALAAAVGALAMILLLFARVTAVERRHDVPA